MATTKLINIGPFIVNGYDENANGQYKYKENCRWIRYIIYTKKTLMYTPGKQMPELYWVKSDSSKF